MTTRKLYKVRLTEREARIIQQVVCDIHDDNAASLSGTIGYRADSAEERGDLKEENVALRQVRAALKRQLPKEGV